MRTSLALTFPIADLREDVFYKCQLDDADLSMADLTRSNLHSMTMTGTAFSRASLRSAVIERATFDDADFGGADLRGAAFYLASLQNTNLSGCDLRGANLTAVVLKDVDMRDANLEGIRYDDATLGFLAGLDPEPGKDRYKSEEGPGGAWISCHPLTIFQGTSSRL